MRKLNAALALCLCASAVLAGPGEDLAAAAERGDAEAQFYLGVMYKDGQGVTQDYTEAVIGSEYESMKRIVWCVVRPIQSTGRRPQLRRQFNRGERADGQIER